MPELYNPPGFKLEDPQTLAAVMDAITFATLVTNGPEGPLASHLPWLLDRQAPAAEAAELGVLRGHLARANPHVTALDGAPALVIFQGPAHYVTPSWYASKAATGKVVPTWNYVVVHARGRVRVHEDRARLAGLVDRLTRRMEADRATPWQVSDAPPSYVERMLGAIVGVDVVIEHLEGKFKLGQNRSPADRASLAAGMAAELPDMLEAFRSLPGSPSDF